MLREEGIVLAGAGFEERRGSLARSVPEREALSAWQHPTKP